MLPTSQRHYVCSDISGGDGDYTSDFGLNLVAMLSCHCGVFDAQLSCRGAKMMTSCLLPATLARQKMAVWIYSHVTQTETPWWFHRDAEVCCSRSIHHSTAQRGGGQNTSQADMHAVRNMVVYFLFLLGSYLMFSGHRRHQTCNKLPVPHYNRSLLSHHDQASDNHYIGAALDRSKAIRPRLELNDR